MNSFQVMRFVDKATPQQLQQMVAARDPYSYMALSKLQEIRDNKLRADAKQLEAPPLTQTIPQQLAQLDQPQGIAALPQAMPQAMPQEQQAPQDMPQEMQQASGIGPAMAPTGAGGGLVSFKHGGIAHFQAAGEVVGRNPGFAQEYGGNPEPIPTPLQIKPTQQQIDEYILTLRKQGKNIGIGELYDIQSGKTKIPDTVTATPVPANAAPTAPPTSALINSNPGAFSFVGGQKDMTPVAATPKAPAMPGSTGLPGMGMFNKQIEAAAKAQTEALEKNRKIVEENKYDPAAANKARGDFEKESDAAYEKMKLMFPDPSSEARKKLDAAQKENESETKQAPYQGLLKMSLALMSTKSPDFLQALGNAGGEGLQEYKSLNENNKKRRDSLIAADAQMSAAQDARSRGLYSDSRNLAFQAQQSRMQALNAERDAKTSYAGLMMGLNLANANVAANKISLLMDATKTSAAVAQAMKPPEAIQTMMFLEKYPQFKIEMQKAETVKSVMAAVGKAESNWETESKMGADLVKNGQLTMPEFNAKYGDAAKDRFINKVRISTLEAAQSTRETLESQSRPSVIPSSAFNLNQPRNPLLKDYGVAMPR